MANAICLLAFHLFPLARLSATAGKTKHNPYRLLPANLTATMTSKSLKTFVSRTHIRDVCSLPGCTGKIASEKFIIERSVTHSLCMFSTCESYALCILMPLHGIDSRADLFCEEMQQAASIHRTSLQLKVSRFNGLKYVLKLIEPSIHSLHRQWRCFGELFR